MMWSVFSRKLLKSEIERIFTTFFQFPPSPNTTRVLSPMVWMTLAYTHSPSPWPPQLLSLKWVLNSHCRPHTYALPYSYFLSPQVPVPMPYLLEMCFLLIYGWKLVLPRQQKHFLPSGSYTWWLDSKEVKRGRLAECGSEQAWPWAQRGLRLLHFQLVAWRTRLLPLSEPQVSHLSIGINRVLSLVSMWFKCNVKSEVPFLVYGTCSINIC